MTSTGDTQQGRSGLPSQAAASAATLPQRGVERAGSRDATPPIVGTGAQKPRRTRTASSRELGLDIAVIFARYLLQTDHLHYGYWTSDLAPELANLKRAQDNYSDFLIGHIPAGVKTVLDVGTGTGALARRLIAAGYEVDCVSPGTYLTERARTLLGSDQCIFECRYEDIQTDKRYDLILFSESFQYIKMERALAISCDHLKRDGHLLISDFFRKDTPDNGPMGGGHPLKDFREQVVDYPLELLVDEDITAQTAPNLDLIADFAARVLAPIRDRVFHYLSSAHPLPFRFVRWACRKPLQQADSKYFSGKRNGASFAAYKSYRFLLFRHRAEQRAAAGESR